MAACCLALSASSVVTPRRWKQGVYPRARFAAPSPPPPATAASAIARARLLSCPADAPRRPPLSLLPRVLASASSDFNVDPERFASTDEYSSSSYTFSVGSFDGDSSSAASSASSSYSPLLNERLEVASQLSESVPSSSAEQLEEGGGGGGGGDDSGNSGNSGDGGKGSSGGGDSGGEENEESSKKNKMITSQKITLAYAALIAAGGAIGYLKSRSTKSLISGVGSGLALLVVYSQLPTNPVFASSLGLGISALLLFVMGSRFKNSGKFFPAGVVSIASFIMTGGYIHGIMRTSHA